VNAGTIGGPSSGMGSRGAQLLNSQAGADSPRRGASSHGKSGHGLPAAPHSASNTSASGKSAAREASMGVRASKTHNNALKSRSADAASQAAVPELCPQLVANVLNDMEGDAKFIDATQKVCLRAQGAVCVA